jgi:dihydrodiol dehydrogenase / D-xylose 1-dehydrogenase (NADP)
LRLCLTIFDIISQSYDTFLSIGIYPIQLACLAFEDEKPLKITASGHLMSTGVDESCSICLLYEGGRMAVVNVNTTTALFAPTHFVGDKGVMQIPDYSWCPSELILPSGEVVAAPHPECPETNFRNSVGLRYQVEACYEAISKGWIEHPKTSHDNSRLICHIIEETKKQLGYE